MDAVEILEKRIADAKQNALYQCRQGVILNVAMELRNIDAYQAAIYALEADDHTEKDAISILRAHIAHAGEIRNKSFATGWMNECWVLDDLIRDYMLAINALQVESYLEQE